MPIPHVNKGFYLANTVVCTFPTPPPRHHLTTTPTPTPSQMVSSPSGMIKFASGNQHMNIHNFKASKHEQNECKLPNHDENKLRNTKHRHKLLQDFEPCHLPIMCVLVLKQAFACISRILRNTSRIIYGNAPQPHACLKSIEACLYNACKPSQGRHQVGRSCGHHHRWVIDASSLPY